MKIEQIAHWEEKNGNLRPKKFYPKSSLEYFFQSKKKGKQKLYACFVEVKKEPLNVQKEKSC